MKNIVVGPKDVKPLEFPWGRITWLQSAEVSGAGEMTLGEVIINPGKDNGVHSHPNCDEILYLISGTLEHSLGDKTIRLEPGMSLYVPKNVKHGATCVSREPARMVVAYSSSRREVVGED